MPKSFIEESKEGKVSIDYLDHSLNLRSFNYLSAGKVFKHVRI